MKYIFVIFCLLCSTSQAFADLLVTPSRIAFDPRDRNKEVILLNTSNETKSYMVEWVTQKQGGSGAYELIDEANIGTFPIAEPFIRFSPRRVTLKPGENQKVKLMVRRKNNMNLSEYRSHLKFTALPNEISEANSPASEDVPSDGINIQLKLLLSYSIPVVLRTEQAKTDVNITNFEYVKNQGKVTAVTIELDKSFDTSVYGDFTIFHEESGQSKAVGFLNGVNIFAENRTFNRAIDIIDSANVMTGLLRVEYKGRSEFANTILAESTLQIN